MKERSHQENVEEDQEQGDEAAQAAFEALWQGPAAKARAEARAGMWEVLLRVCRHYCGVGFDANLEKHACAVCAEGWFSQAKLSHNNDAANALVKFLGRWLEKRSGTGDPRYFRLFIGMRGNLSPKPAWPPVLALRAPGALPGSSAEKSQPWTQNRFVQITGLAAFPFSAVPGVPLAYQPATLLLVQDIQPASERVDTAGQVIVHYG